MEKEGDKLLIEILKKYIKKGNSVLEIGAGNCDFLKNIVYKFDVTGYGVDPYIYSLDKEKLKCFKIKGEDISKLKKRFDIIYLLRSLHHIKNPEVLFNEIKTYLNNNGKLIIVDWKKGTETGIPENYFSLNEVKSLMLKFNLEIVEECENSWYLVIVGIVKF